MGLPSCRSSPRSVQPDGGTTEHEGQRIAALPAGRVAPIERTPSRRSQRCEGLLATAQRVSNPGRRCRPSLLPPLVGGADAGGAGRDRARRRGRLSTVSDEPLVRELWRQQSVWSQTANRMTAAIGRARGASLTLTVVSAVLGTAAGAVSGAQPAMGAGLAVAAAIGVGLLPVLRPRWSGSVVRDWTRARSVSEALKSEVYLYVAGAGDYRGEDRGARLALATDRVREQAADLLRHGAGIEPVDRGLPDVHDYQSYLAVRVGAQVDGYYRPKARHFQARLRQFRRLQVALSVVAVVLGALATRFTSWGLGSWLAVITTITAAVAAHVASARYEYQLIEYLRTADELSRLKRDATRTTSPTALDEIVIRCERIISIQNEGWMAKFSAIPDKDAEL